MKKKLQVFSDNDEDVNYFATKPTKNVAGIEKSIFDDSEDDLFGGSTAKSPVLKSKKENSKNIDSIFSDDSGYYF